VSELVGALGVSRGTFLEMGAHDGEFESNSIFLEACWRWRAILLEPNPSSFAMVRRGRPGALAVRAAVCREPGQVTFAPCALALRVCNRRPLVGWSRC